MTKAKATIVGFLVAPMIPAVYGALTTDTFGPLDVLTFLVWFIVFYNYALWPTCLFGVPLFFVFKRYNLIRWWSTALTGLLIGMLVAVIFAAPNTVTLGLLLTMGLLGYASAFTFWLIWSRGKRGRKRGRRD